MSVEGKQHVMIDLETWSLNKNGLIIAIGAVKFELDGTVDEDSPKFECGINPSSYNPVMNSFHMDPGTIGWWLADSQEAPRKYWNAMEKHPIAEALVGFSTWLNAADPEGYILWGNGASFDLVLLRHAFDVVLGKGVCPWSYKAEACYRTQKLLHDVPVDSIPDMGSHTALGDAMWQARHLQLIHRKINPLTAVK